MKSVIVTSILALVLVAPAALAADEVVAVPAGKPALIVMDVQNAFMPYMDEEDIEGAVQMINATIALFREAGLPVIRVYQKRRKGTLKAKLASLKKKKKQADGGPASD